MADVVDNVVDRRRRRVGSWTVQPLSYAALRQEDVGRVVILRLRGRDPEAGVISSWRNGIVFVRFTLGDTAAACRPTDLVFGLRPLDTPEAILKAHQDARDTPGEA